jgi:uncharacterized protein YfaP (DUF2135 family)
MTASVLLGLLLAVVAPGAAAGDLIVTLRWDAAVDLDLYVTDPVLETAYFANPHTASGGMLERDARCAGRTPGEQMERVRWTKPPPGRYRVGVDFLEACGKAGEREVRYRLQVEIDGMEQEVSGRARLAEREARVFEFMVPPAREGAR